MGKISIVPPAASILLFALSLTACTLTIKLLFNSPFPKSFTGFKMLLIKRCSFNTSRVISPSDQFANYEILIAKYYVSSFCISVSDRSSSSLSRISSKE